MYDLNDLYFFAQVVDHGGFAPAGRALGVAKSKLSRRVAMLEERLGARLVFRSTRRFSVTELGQTYYAHCKAMLAEARAAEDAVALSRTEPCGVVRLSCPLTLLDTRVAPMLADYMRQHRQVRVHLLALDRPVDVVAEGIDVAIRVRPPPLEDSELVLRVLSDRSQCLVASPALLQEFGTPLLPPELAALPSLALGVPQTDHIWRLFDAEGTELAVQHQPRFITRGMNALRTAALAGVGVVQLPRMMVQAHLDAGELVALLPGWNPRREIIHAVFASRRYLLPAVRSLIDFLAARFEAIAED